MSRERNGGNGFDIVISEASRIDGMYRTVDNHCHKLLISVAKLSLERTDSNGANLFHRLGPIYSDIIRLNKLFHQLSRITKFTPELLDKYRLRIKNFLDWVEVLDRQQSILAENNSPFETVQLAMYRIKAGVKLNITNFAEVRTALSKIVDQCEKGTQPIPAHFIQYILAFKRRDIAELERSCPKDIPTQLIFYIALRARVNSALSKQWLEADHAPGQ